MKAGKTLVIQNLQGIGDTMWFVRHLQTIAAGTRSGTVSLLTRPRSMADKILEADPCIREVLWLKIKPGDHDGFLGTLRLAAFLKQHKFETAWILHSRSLRYAMACRLAGIKNVIGIGHGWQKYLVTNKNILTPQQQVAHPIRRGGYLLQHQGLTLNQDKAPCVVAPALKSFVTKTFGDHPRPWVGLGVASSEGHKKWLWQNYVELGAHLHGETGAHIFVMGGPAEADEATQIVKGLQARGVPATPCTHLTIQQSLGLIQRCDFIVGNDTGILHAAPMVGSKGLVLLGKAQVPIHHYAEVEGLRLADSDQVAPPPNNIQDISVGSVFQKLKDLGWI